MTKNEMKEAISEYCSHHACLSCPYVSNICDRYDIDIDAVPEHIINEWYNLLFCNNTVNQNNNNDKPSSKPFSQPNNDAVNHPSHYCDGGIETIDYIRAKMSREEFIGYCKGNALKYISRAGKKAKNSIEKDIRKAITYLEWARDVEKESEK